MNAYRSIFINPHKTYFQKAQRPQLKNRLTELDRKDNGKYPWNHWNRRRISEHNTLSTGTKVQLIHGTHENEKWQTTKLETKIMFNSWKFNTFV